MFQYFFSSRPIDWVGRQGPPIPEPPCGFNGEKCVHENQPDWRSFVICTISGVVLIVAIGLVSRFDTALIKLLLGHRVDAHLVKAYLTCLKQALSLRTQIGLLVVEAGHPRSYYYKYREHPRTYIVGYGEHGGDPSFIVDDIRASRFEQ